MRKWLFNTVSWLVNRLYGHRWERRGTNTRYSAERVPGSLWRCARCARSSMAPTRALFDPCWARLP